MHMKQTTLKPGQLVTYKNHVYRVKRVDIEKVCDHCELEECRSLCIIFPGCKWDRYKKYTLPSDCELTLVK